MQNPPFCPNACCRNHLHPEVPDWWRKDGFHATKTFGSVQRFQCLRCGTSFSSQTFSVHYFAKCIVNLRALERRLSSSMSIRALSRDFKRSCGTILNRIDRLARQGIALHAHLRPTRNQNESTCYDNLVSFDRSQYFPNNIGISITATSHYALGLSHATMRRSGRMSKAQKARRARIDQKVEFEARAVERSMFSHLSMLQTESSPYGSKRTVLVTDKKLEYEQALKIHPLYRGRDAEHQLTHVRVSSKAPRTVSNPLFASNYFDREVRKDLAQHRRETACFARSPANGMSRMAVYLVYHNYEKRYFIKGKEDRKETAAEMAGINPMLIKHLRRSMFSRRAILSRMELVDIDKAIWEKQVYEPTEGGMHWSQLPRYACA